MGAYVGVTDGRWAAFLAARPRLPEVNFWVPNPTRRFRALRPGEAFLFKSKYPQNRIIGGGFFETYEELRVSEAWNFFGEGNGVADATALRLATGAYRSAPHHTQPAKWPDDPTIGCIILMDVTWFGDSSLPGPTSFAKNVVSGKRYHSGEDSIVDLALARLLARVDGPSSTQQAEPNVLGPTRGSPRLVIPRMNQGAFRAAVLNAYEARCAISGHRIRPTLQAAHIRPVAHGGEHRVDNGLLLRSDIHTLFDLGYITVDPGYQLRVSPRLRADFGNGDELYARAASDVPIALPSAPTHRPDREALQWHGDTTFLAS